MMNIASSDVCIVARKWQKWGSRNCHTNLVTAHPGAYIITSETSNATHPRILRLIKESCNETRYNSISASLELNLVRAALRKQPRLVSYLFADNDYKYGWIAKRLSGCYLVGNYFFSIEEFERRMPDMRPLGDFDLVTASGAAQLDYLRQYATSRAVHYLPLGVDSHFFSPRGDYQQVVQSSRRILHVGDNRRDYAMLRDVWRILKTRYTDLELHLVSYSDPMKHLAGLRDVVIHPYLDDVQLRDLYRSAAVVLLPVTEGGSSQTLNEAMACGLPIVVTVARNLEDYLPASGVLRCALGDAESMAALASNVLEDDDLARDLSRQVRVHAQTLDFSVVRSRIYDLYRSVLGVNVVAD